MKLARLKRILPSKCLVFLFWVPVLFTDLLCYAESIPTLSPHCSTDVAAAQLIHLHWGRGGFAFLLAIKETDYENALTSLSVKKACYATIALQGSDPIFIMKRSSLKFIRVK